MLPFTLVFSISILGGYGTFGIISQQVRGPNYYILAPVLGPFLLYYILHRHWFLIFVGVMIPLGSYPSKMWVLIAIINLPYGGRSLNEARFSTLSSRARDASFVEARMQYFQPPYWGRPLL